ncbi:Uncharacterised protein [[Clostridium] sordellii]|uniref:HEPN domain-containing protein n=1 Tax=Paraclostridium sordellii TaxID=1505 RepID=UPI0005DAF1F7|nr:HEPN domain-containing protein [Paeniclostridium sordellii]CEN83684.1 Uncharacterised protein [[Clostridium] sordellii] [Paeniclostridium sordellii]CEO10444.1 Uncharacterised protein [[Clostridium] sordellii] [Paeniclostridium sordellii]
MIRVEYFIIIDKKEEYLKESKHFINILKMIDCLSIENELIKYNDVEIDYKVKIINVDDRIINCQFSIEDTENIDEFEKFLRVFRTIFSKIVGIESIETLWDDTGFYYAKLAYPIIHKIENEMRSLITKFMYINVGRNWASKHVPEEVKNSIKNKKNNKSKEIANFLDKVDFIQLTNFLFEEYSSFDKNKIINFIKENKNTDFKYEQLEKYIPISNWDRFFKEKLNLEGRELKNKWEELYELRCKVAHNNKINKSDYQRIKELSEDMEEKIKYAMDSLDTIKIDEEDKAKILNKMHSITDELKEIGILKKSIKIKANKGIGINSKELQNLLTNGTSIVSSRGTLDTLTNGTSIVPSRGTLDTLTNGTSIVSSRGTLDTLTNGTSIVSSRGTLDILTNSSSTFSYSMDNKLKVEGNISDLDKK